MDRPFLVDLVSIRTAHFLPSGKNAELCEWGECRLAGAIPQSQFESGQTSQKHHWVMFLPKSDSPKQGAEGESLRARHSDHATGAKAAPKP